MSPDAPAPARDRASASSADVSPAHGERRDGKTKRSSATKKKASARRPRRDGRDAKHDPWARVEDLAGTKHYDVLGVPRDADARVIKRAYREMARTSHPDKGGSDAAFAAVRAAFETLGHPARRAAYDALASEHEYRYIPGVTPRARGGEDAMLDDLERLGLSLDPGSQLVVLCEVCGRPSNKTCFACGIKFCDFCTRKLHWRGGVGLHYPVTNKPGHLRRSLAEKELEKKIEEDARRRLTSDPNYRHDAELAEIRRFKERVAEISRSVGDAFGSRATLTRTFDRRLARYYMWAQTARKVHVAVYVPTGYGDKDLRVEIVPDGGASGGGFGDFGAFSDFAGESSASGGIVLVQPEDSPPVVERALAGLIDASAPVETLRSRDGRRCALSLTKARPGETWTRLFQGDPDFARALRQPYVTHETNEEVTVTFDALPFWVRKDDVRVDVTHAGVRVRCESAGLENLERTFWRGDDAEAGDGDASAEDASADASASSGGGVLSGGELDANASSVGEEKNKKNKHEPFMLPATAAWSLARDETRTANDGARDAFADDVSLELVIGKRDPTAQESQFKKGVVQDNRQDKRVWNPNQSLGARLFREDQDDFFLEDDLTALVFFETGEAPRPAKPWAGDGEDVRAVARAPAELSENARAVLEHLVAMAEAEDGDVPGDVPGDGVVV
jgi:curved DNA-binding protein CbpA